jgi:hypothetical protein
MRNKKELEKSFNRKRGDLREKSPFYRYPSIILSLSWTYLNQLMTETETNLTQFPKLIFRRV